MALSIHSVVNSNDPNTEFVWIQNSIISVNLKPYAVVDRTFDAAGKVSNEFRHIFTFPSLVIGKDDWIRLYTGKGTYSKTPIEKRPGSYIHNFYWQSDHCVWNGNGSDTASLINYTLVNSVKVPGG